jgi:hypothetical protein
MPGRITAANAHNRGKRLLVFKTGRAEQPSAWMVRFHRRSVARTLQSARFAPYFPGCFPTGRGGNPAKRRMQGLRTIARPSHGRDIATFAWPRESVPGLELDITADARDAVVAAAARARWHRVPPKARHPAVAHSPAGLAHQLGNRPQPHAKGSGPASSDSIVHSGTLTHGGYPERASAKVAHRRRPDSGVTHERPTLHHPGSVWRWQGG